MASRVVLDEASGKVLQEQTYPGRPQSSRQEFQDAICIIGGDPALGRLIAEGAIVRGGAVIGEGVRVGPGNVLAAGIKVFPGTDLPAGAIKF